MKIDLNYIFINLVKELESRINSGTAFDLIRSAGLLRLLLLDKAPILHQINREKKTKIQFRINNLPKESDELLPHKYFTLQPIPDCPTKTVNLQNFLKEEILFYAETSYTVKELIQNLCNFLGGIHFVKPKQKSEIEFVELDHLNKGITLKTEAIKWVSKITLKTLSPIVDEIQLITHDDDGIPFGIRHIS